MMKVISVCAVSIALSAVVSAQVPAGPEFRVNSYTVGRQTYARPTMEADGRFVVVWTSNGQDGSGDGAFGQRFEASGTPRGAEFRIHTSTLLSQYNAVASTESHREFVVVWTSFEDGSASSVHGRRYEAGGNPVGSEFRVNTVTTGLQFRPDVGRASDGSFVVLWTSGDVGVNDLDIAAQRFDASGAPAGGEFVVNTYTTGLQLWGGIAVAADGGFVVIWEDDARSLILGQRFDSAGNRLGTEFQTGISTLGPSTFPSVSMSPAGGFVVAGAVFSGGSDVDTFARRSDALGNPLGNDFIVNTYTTGSQLPVSTWRAVAHDSRGNFVITWSGHGAGDSSYPGVFAQRFASSGVRRGSEFRVNTYTTGYQLRSSVASDAVGNFVVSWQSAGQDGSDYGIFAQRFGGLRPTALDVDAVGNRVLEPGETVAVRPSWRNFNGAAQTFSGMLTTITGPVGATYTITDAAGDYGTVANGATAPCTDCYAVSVSNPATRPVVHWDAAAVESILPDTQGQQKQWLLHVGRSFTDVPAANIYDRFIETLLHHGVTGGCSPTQYCPASSTTRDQMAVFVLVAKEGTGYVPPACTTPVFADVPASNPFCRWIEELARRAVVSGCGGGNYCPSSAVTREQMAVFVLRTLEPALTPPDCTAPLYNDVPASSGFCRWIEELTRRAVVSGCGGGNYCPTASVTREQMGVFMSVTFGLTLYGF